MASTKSQNARLALRLVLSAALMFGFGFALVPLYDVFCRVTGLNGKLVNTGAPAETLAEDTARKVRVQMIAINNEAMPWQFKPKEALVNVHPGEQKLSAYLAHNPTDKYMIAQAVPSISPSEAAPYLHKVNCFCFDRQPLKSKETREMPLLFVIDPELPAHINTITLSYTLFDITSKQRTAMVEPASTGRSGS